MSLYKDPLIELTEAIANANRNVLLVPDQYTFDKPTPITGTRNTSITITSKGPQSAYDGSVTVQYNRLNLSDLNRIAPWDIPAGGIVDTHSLAPVLTRLYGLPLLPEDYINERYTLTNGKGSVRVRAAPESLRWLGSVNFSIIPPKPELSTVVRTKRLDGYKYPYKDTTKPFARMYSYWRDFSAAEDVLVLLSEGETDLDILADAMATVTGDKWTMVPSQRYSLDGAVVTYNGDTTYKTSNNDYDKVLVIELSDSNLGYNGELWIHYNITDEVVG